MADPTVMGNLNVTAADGDVTGVQAVGAGGLATSLLSGVDPKQDLNTMFVLTSGFLVRPDALRISRSPCCRLRGAMLSAPWRRARVANIRRVGLRRQLPRSSSATATCRPAIKRGAPTHC
jgi:hypothetical protein